MRRRANKSTKVPNVKLRPVQQVPKSRPDDSSIWPDDTQFGSDDTVAVDPCPRPFKGVVLCATGAFDKPTLFKQAVELGATITTAFTDRVTHLVAVDHGGAKYHCALERKIPILRPTWVEDSYKIWLRGDDVELGEEVIKYRLDIFSGVVLCLSGVTDITRRTQINKLVNDNGGSYLKAMERPIRVTHLLCSGDEETEKMRYAEKFNSKGEAKVHLVWEEWFWDSLEFGGRFDEEKYQVRRPRPERRLPQEESAVISPPASTAPSNQPQDDQDEPQEELANVKRLPETTLQLWGGLLGRRGYEISEGQLIKSPSKVSPNVPPPSAPSPDKAKGGVISQFRRANSFAPPRPEALSSSLPQPFRRSRTTLAIESRVVDGSFMASVPPVRERSAIGESSTSGNPRSMGIFSGLKFSVLGEAKSPSVRTAIEENGGRMLMGLEDEVVDYIIVRLVSGSKLYMQEPNESLRCKYRTECWLERCVFQERVCTAEDHITFSPLNIVTPVAGAEAIRLSFSGLDQAEATWITRLLRALGVKLEKVFSKKTTHLLCPSGTGLKFDKAQEWGLPIVTVPWLAHIATTGAIPAASEFLVSAHKPIDDPMDLDVVTSDKGKGVDRREQASPSEEPIVETLPAEMSGPDEIVDHAAQDRPLGLSPRRTQLDVVPVFHVDSILATSTQRNPTTPRHPKRGSTVLQFGKPIGVLAGGASQRPSTPTRTRSTPIFHHTPHHHNSHPKSSAPIARRPTQREIEQERKQAKIPSSRSPSPLKTQRAAQGQPQSLEQIAIESPTRIPREVAKALEDNITTLLGKRTSEEAEPGAAPKNSRPGKRQRPQRPTRGQSRKTSDKELPQLVEVPIADYDDSLQHLEGFDEALDVLGAGKVEDNGIRVTYEDPKQQAETKRLMSLLNAGGKGPSSGPKGSIGTRKSARIAGF